MADRRNSALKRVLDTGGAGFLGSHLCERFIADGCQVYCLDNTSTGSIENISGLRRHVRFSFLHQDVMAPIAIDVGEIYSPRLPGYVTDLIEALVRLMATPAEETGPIPS